MSLFCSNCFVLRRLYCLANEPPSRQCITCNLTDKCSGYDRIVFEKRYHHDTSTLNRYNPSSAARCLHDCPKCGAQSTSEYVLATGSLAKYIYCVDCRVEREATDTTST